MMRHVRPNCQVQIDIDKLMESNIDVKAMGLVIKQVTRIDSVEVYGGQSGCAGVDQLNIQKSYDSKLLKIEK